MPTKTNRALIELMREVLEQNAHGLITDWEAICAISQYASKALTPADGDLDPSTGLKYAGCDIPQLPSTDPFCEPDFDAEATAGYVNQDR